MADPTPLLNVPDDAEPPKLTALKHPGRRDSIDSVIDDVVGDGFTLVPFLRAMLVSFAWFFDAQQAFVSVFADAEPAWHCRDETACFPGGDVCGLPRGSWAWDLSAQASTVSEWGLRCAGALAAGALASAFFAGSLIGGLILAGLADTWLGRKRLLSLTCLAAAMSALLTALSPGPLAYAALRFAGGVGRAAIGSCALVLPTELVGRRWRGLAGVAGFVFFTLGFLSLPGLAFLNRGQSWRNLYIFTSIPAILYSISIHFLVPESPRWLFIRGRKQEAIEALKTMAGDKNNRRLSAASFSSIPSEPPSTSSNNLFSAVEMLVSKPWALRRLLAVMALGFGTGMVYYGMPLALGSLPFNLYLSVTLNALSEFPASAATYLLAARAGWKASIFLLTVSSGVLSVASAVPGAPDGLKIGLEIGPFFAACTAANLQLIYTVELFPTAVRNSAVSAVRQAVVLGGVAAPLLAAAGRGGRGLLSFGVFGAVIGLSGLFVFFLPETIGKALSDTMEDEEHNSGAKGGDYSAV